MRPRRGTGAGCTVGRGRRPHRTQSAPGRPTRRQPRRKRPRPAR
jgi:hypothetical protein